MLTRNQEAGMFCFVIAVIMIWAGVQIRTRKKAEWLPGYKKKPGENTAAFCGMAGKGVILAGIGMLILSVPISQAEPDKYFALCCLLSCLVFTGMGLSLYFRAERLYRP